MSGIVDRLSFSEGDFMRVLDPHLFMRVSRLIFEKPGITVNPGIPITVKLVIPRLAGTRQHACHSTKNISPRYTDPVIIAIS